MTKASSARFARPAALLLLLMLPFGASLGAGFDKPVTKAISVVPASAEGGPTATNLPFILDGGRIYVRAKFRKPDGSDRDALVWVNFGVGSMSLSPALHAELGGGAVAFALGDARVRVEPDAIQKATQETFAQLGPLPVEAVLPAGMWPLFRVTLDYPARILTLASPVSTPVPGTEVPMLVNPDTGVASVRLAVDGKLVPVALDPGAGYTWIRGDDVRGWLKANPEWYRADGALGASNQAMMAENVEQLGTVVRVERMQIGALVMENVGVLGTAPATGHPIDQFKDAMLWKLWGKGAAEPVFGWLGGNALRPYRLTLDYANQLSYWERTGEPQASELDSVGISLIKGTKYYRVGSVITRHGTPDLIGPRVGDRLIAIDGQPAGEMTREAIQQALRGTPGASRRLALERNGVPISVDAVIIGEMPVSAAGS
jgi:hypothetical protein